MYEHNSYSRDHLNEQMSDELWSLNLCKLLSFSESLSPYFHMEVMSCYIYLTESLYDSNELLPEET